MDIIIREKSGRILDPSHVTTPLRCLVMFRTLFLFSLYVDPNEGTPYY